jgi:hypothetical protein
MGAVKFESTAGIIGWEVGQRLVAPVLLDIINLGMTTSRVRVDL